MYACRFCGRSFESGQKLGGHARMCYSNANREMTIKKIGDKRRGRLLSLDQRSKISKTIQAKIVEGTWHNSFARSRKHLYAGESFDGSWEVKLATWFDSQSIKWIRNKRSFPYTYDKQRRYVPDFYLPNIDCYVEVKGWKTPKDEAKWQQFSKRLVILSGSDLQSLGIPITVHKDWK